MKTALPWSLALALGLAASLPGCASAAAAPPAMDDGSSSRDYGRPGLYVAVGAMRGFENFDTAGPTLRAKDSDFGFVVRGGYHLGESAALEVSLEDARGFNLEQGSSSLDVNIASVVAQGKWYFSDGMLEPYLLGGIGWARADVETLDLDGNAAFLRAGAGVDLYLSHNIALFAEVNYNRMTGDLRDLDHYDAVAGIVLRF
jgi:opacity protein-like surface antigen